MPKFRLFELTLSLSFWFWLNFGDEYFCMIIRLYMSVRFDSYLVEHSLHYALSPRIWLLVDTVKNSSPYL
ncbi:hypothetical protein HZ326_12039 [Fusarium oxysporum f. sp. albedinis]|nr:hypothetical protein HZ326_12039 [Fusarium oxysporum f. sp. albedinis]